MKPPVKYGLLITLGVVLWVVITHLLIPDPRSPVHSVGAGVFFNLLHIAGIYLAINAVRNSVRGELRFKDGLKTGMTTAFVFALTACVFFVAAIFVVGPELMASEPGAANMPRWQVALGAFAGMLVGTLLFGLIYSTVISFFLARRSSRD